MLNTIYRLTEPRKIEVEFNEIDTKADSVIVRPVSYTHLDVYKRQGYATRYYPVYEIPRQKVTAETTYEEFVEMLEKVE